MTRPLLITLTLAAVGSAAGAAEAKGHRSSLPANEQRRVVCVTQRDEAGPPADQTAPDRKVCMTAREWELAAVDLRRSQARRTGWLRDPYPRQASRPSSPAPAWNAHQMRVAYPVPAK